MDALPTPTDPREALLAERARVLEEVADLVRKTSRPAAEGVIDRVGAEPEPEPEPEAEDKPEDKAEDKPEDK